MEEYNPQKSEPKWPHTVWCGVNKKYNPAEVESKWERVWEKKLSFKALDFDKKKKKLYTLVEFPYPSGEGLHIGHAFTCTILDIFARKKRMEGTNVLYPMGWDAFGLPTENYAIKTGIHPAVATKKNTNRFREQMKRLGFAYNWDREINTTDPSYYKWTQWIFIQLFKNGLAYKKKMPINWCPSCKIGLANEEVVDGKCERCGVPVGQKELDQWLLKITAYADRLADELDLVDFPESVVAAQRNWIGRSEGATIKFVIADFSPRQYIEVFTTRPDTLWGATFMVLSPEHRLVEKILSQDPKVSIGFHLRGGTATPPRELREIRKYVEQAKKKTELERVELQKEKTGVFTGLYALNPAANKKIPVWISDFVLSSYGTGAIMGVPAHDQRDFDFAKKYKLEIKPVVDPNPKDPNFAGICLDVDEARKKGGVIEAVKRLVREGKICYVGEGTAINSGRYSDLTTTEFKKRIIEDLEKNGFGKRAVSYHLRDWIFSRQHYWGEPTPMVYCPKCAKKGITWWQTKEGERFKPLFSPGVSIENHSRSELGSHLGSGSLAGWFPVLEEELPVKLPEVKRYQPTGTGESPLAAVKEWVKTRCPVCGGSARRETDTMPNWAGSSWYFLRYIDPKNDKVLASKKKLDYWMPVDLYLGGAEHTTLHLLYSRFWHKFLNDIKVAPGKEPYLARRVHGVVLGEDSFRMSKSRGNVVDPKDVIEKFGVDTLRVYLMFMGPYDKTLPWSTKGVRGCFRFLSRVWKLVNASQGNTSDGDPPQSNAAGTFDVPKGLLQGGGIGEQDPSNLKRLMHQTIKKVTGDIEAMKFNTAIAALMEYVNTLHATRYTLHAKEYKEAIKTLLLLLAPFAPYIAEELWQCLKGSEKRSDLLGKAESETRLFSPDPPTGGEGPGRTSMKWSIHQQPWPKYNERLAKEEEVRIVVEVNGKVRAEVNVKCQMSNVKKEIEKRAKKDPKVKKHLAGKKIKRVIFLSGKLINFVTE